MKCSSFHGEKNPKKIQRKPSKPIKLHLQQKCFYDNLKEPSSPTEQEILELRDSLFKTHNFENISIVKLLKLHGHLKYYSKSFMEQRQYINARKFLYLQEEVEAEILTQNVSSRYIGDVIANKRAYKIKSSKSPYIDQDVNSILFKFDLETDKKLEEMDSNAIDTLNQFENNWKGHKKDDPFIRFNKGQTAGNYQCAKSHLIRSLNTEKKLYREERQRKRDEIVKNLKLGYKLDNEGNIIFDSDGNNMNKKSQPHPLSDEQIREKPKFFTRNRFTISSINDNNNNNNDDETISKQKDTNHNTNNVSFKAKRKNITLIRKKCKDQDNNQIISKCDSKSISNSTDNQKSNVKPKRKIVIRSDNKKNKAKNNLISVATMTSDSNLSELIQLIEINEDDNQSNTEDGTNHNDSINHKNVVRKHKVISASNSTSSLNSANRMNKEKLESEKNNGQQEKINEVLNEDNDENKENNKVSKEIEDKNNENKENKEDENRENKEDENVRSPNKLESNILDEYNSSGRNNPHPSEATVELANEIRNQRKELCTPPSKSELLNESNNSTSSVFSSTVGAIEIRKSNESETLEQAVNEEGKSECENNENMSINCSSARNDVDERRSQSDEMNSSIGTIEKRKSVESEKLFQDKNDERKCTKIDIGDNKSESDIKSEDAEKNKSDDEEKSKGKNEEKNQSDDGKKSEDENEEKNRSDNGKKSEGENEEKNRSDNGKKSEDENEEKNRSDNGKKSEDENEEKNRSDDDEKSKGDNEKKNKRENGDDNALTISDLSDFEPYSDTQASPNRISNSSESDEKKKMEKSEDSNENEKGKDDNAGEKEAKNDEYSEADEKVVNKTDDLDSENSNRSLKPIKNKDENDEDGGNCNGNHEENKKVMSKSIDKSDDIKEENSRGENINKDENENVIKINNDRSDKEKEEESDKEKKEENDKEKKEESDEEKKEESDKEKKIESDKEKKVESDEEKKEESNKEKKVESDKEKKVESDKEKKVECDEEKKEEKEDDDKSEKQEGDKNLETASEKISDGFDYSCDSQKNSPRILLLAERNESASANDLEEVVNIENDDEEGNKKSETGNKNENNLNDQDTKEEVTNKEEIDDEKKIDINQLKSDFDDNNDQIVYLNPVSKFPVQFIYEDDDDFDNVQYDNKNKVTKMFFSEEEEE